MFLKQIWIRQVKNKTKISRSIISMNDVENI